MAYLSILFSLTKEENLTITCTKDIEDNIIAPMKELFMLPILNAKITHLKFLVTEDGDEHKDCVRYVTKIDADEGNDLMNRFRQYFTDRVKKSVNSNDN